VVLDQGFSGGKLEIIQAEPQNLKRAPTKKEIHLKLLQE